MTIELDIKPGVGIGPIVFGMPRNTVRARVRELGFELSAKGKSTDYFCNNAIQVQYSDEGGARYIGVACEPLFSLTYRGRDLYRMEAEQSFDLFAANEGSGPHRYDSSGYFFPTQMVTLWEADTQYDHLTDQSRVVWGQVGLGRNAVFELNEGAG